MNSQDAQTALDHVVPFLTTYALQVLGAVVILVAGRIAAGLGARLTRRAMTRGNVDDSLVGFAASLVKGAIIVFAAIAALAKFGIQTASFVAVLGAAGLAVGLALQGSLSNFAAGVLILLFRPFRVGDVIDSSDSRGKVQEIGILTTILATPDNQKIILPNASVMSNKIINVNAFPKRRIDLVASIGYDDDISKAREVLRDVLASHPQVLQDPAPVVEVFEMADSSVNLVVRPWVETADYWPVYFDLTRSIKIELERNGLSIPFPQRDVHLYQAAPAAS
jgi:small conductance mechanosensitive channel